MRIFLFISLLFFQLIFTFEAKATHIIGGFLNYECLGPVANSSDVSYLLSLHIYVDCGPNSNQIVEDAPITFFNSAGVYQDDIQMPLISSSTIPDGSFNPCVVQDTSICAIEEVYSQIIQLNANSSHIITYQRCCRNDIIDNLINPDAQGSTYTLEVPVFSSVGCNSSPIFSAPPPISFCGNYDMNLDMSATDLDGDSLVYSLCAPYNYSSQSNPRPIPAFSPPYAKVPFSPPFTATNPLPAMPALNIDPNTGLLSGSPTQLGQYVVGFCVEEYRNGILLGTSRRDIQINIENCDPVITTAVQDQVQFCEGLSVQFKNNSSSTDLDTLLFFWDFGDTTTLGDTSRLKEPTYTFPDTGLYTITLITNPGYPCSDTSTEQYRLYPELDPLIDYEGLLCLDSNSINFYAAGQFESYATFEWNFFNANQNSSIQDSVFEVQFSGSNPEAQLIASQNGCSDTVRQVIDLFPNPIADFDYAPSAGCYPLPVDFQNRSQTAGNAKYSWSFGDGNSSTNENPSNTYTSNGYFDVNLEVITTDKCIDTVNRQIDSAIYISLDSSKNKVDFDFFPKEGCPPLSVNFSDSSFYEGGANYFWDFGDGSLSTDADPNHIYTDSGYYSIGLMLITTDKCVDTLVYSLDSAIRVLPTPQGVLVASDSAKPKKEATFTFDGRMSIGYVNSTFVIEGVKYSNTDFMEYEFRDTGRYQVTQIVENSLGCLDTVSLSVFVYDVYEFIIPNIFTPNGDGINDTFAPKGSGIYEYEVQIFNRFGLEVFASNSLNIQWDGRIEGKKAQSGTYFYRIRIKDFRGGYRNFQGPLTLLKD